MTWARTLKDWALGSPRAAVEAAGSTLTEIHAGFRERALRLARHAELAPNASAQHELGRLAEEQGRMAERLRAILGERGIPTADVTTTADPPAGLNHWARIVRDLELLREARSRLFEVAEQIGDFDERLGEELAGLARDLEAQLPRLRSLIARADPQSLN